MTELGKLLQQTRKRKKYSLDKVNKLTRLSLKYIKALEESDSSVFPAEIYHKSSLKNYAKFLELDIDEVLELYEKEKTGVQYELFSEEEINKQIVKKDNNKTKVKKKPTVQVQQSKEEKTEEIKETEESENKEQETEVKENTKKVSFVSQIAGIIVLFLCLFVLINFFVIKNKSNKIEQPEEVKPVGISNVREEIIDTSIAKQLLEIEAEQDSWVRIFADGNQIFEGILHFGQQQKCFADDNFTIRIGNVDNVKVSFNGKPADILTGAKADRTNTLTFKKDTEI